VIFSHHKKRKQIIKIYWSKWKYSQLSDPFYTVRNFKDWLFYALYLFYLFERIIFYDVYQDKFKEFGISCSYTFLALNTGRFPSNYLEDSNFHMHSQ